MNDPNTQDQLLEQEEKKHNSWFTKTIRNLSNKQILLFAGAAFILYWAKYIKNPPMANKELFTLLGIILIIAYLLIMKNEDTEILDFPGARRILKKEIILMQDAGDLPEGILRIAVEGRLKTWKTQGGYNPTRYEIAFTIETIEEQEIMYSAEIHVKSRKLVGVVERPYGWSGTEIKDFELIPSREKVLEDRMYNDKRQQK